MIVESIFAVTLICSMEKRRDMEPLSSQFQIVGKSFVLQRTSGNTLEYTMINEIENLPGVISAAVKRTGDTFNVSVIMENMDFGPYSKVAEKELSLDKQYPSLTFNFEILPKDALEDSSVLHYNAA